MGSHHGTDLIMGPTDPLWDRSHHGIDLIMRSISSWDRSHHGIDLMMGPISTWDRPISPSDRPISSWDRPISSWDRGWVWVVVPWHQNGLMVTPLTSAPSFTKKSTASSVVGPANVITVMAKQQITNLVI